MPRRVVTFTAAIILLFSLIALFRFSRDSPQKIREPEESITGHHPYVKPNLPQWDPPKPKTEKDQSPADRLVLKVRLETEDVSWLDRLPAPWAKESITIDNEFAQLHPGGTRVDKGRVANAYLEWIIKNYHFLPKTMIFLPPERQQPNSVLQVPDAIARVRVPYIQSSGFVHLQCPLDDTCNHLDRPFHSPPHQLRTMDINMTKIWGLVFEGTPLAEDFATPPSAKFAVSKTQVQKRSVEEYLRAWTWLNKTTMDDDSAGLVLEYLWPYMFGMDPIFCPEFRKCECEVFVRC
ncbi:hypothetical protein DDE83_001827 [Stemphylium lycopersici]|uniref:Uncharacterized protein n=1 Tax=Stemphylium lycopersici TaxID=183478 RepID=A0A364NBV7_STELY|nr:hypothetical protein DDE83_001827 [Stemphylium lycopersici]